MQELNWKYPTNQHYWAANVTPKRKSKRVHPEHVNETLSVEEAALDGTTTKFLLYRTC